MSGRWRKDRLIRLRAGAGTRGHSTAIAALLVLLVAAPLLVALHHAPRQPLPARTAIRDALRSPSVTGVLAGTHRTSAGASALDGRLVHVSFLAGSRTLVAVAVRPDGTIDRITGYARHSVPFGDWIAYEPAVLACLSALFILMLGVVPLRRARNLDALTVLSLVATVILFQRGYLSASVLAVVPGLCCLALRCALRGFGFGRPPPALSLLAQGTRATPGPPIRTPAPAHRPEAFTDRREAVAAR